MARNQTLGSILDLFRSEAKLSLNPAHHAQQRDSQVARLKRINQQLWSEFEWPLLRIWRDYPLQQAQRYYDVSADFDLTRIEKIEVRFGGRWCTLERGVNARHYAAVDSDLGEESWPVAAWQIREDEQIEFWPIANTNGTLSTLEGYFRVYGIQQLPAFNDADDRTPIDDIVLAMMAASEVLIGRGEEGAVREGQQKAALAETRRMRLIGSVSDVKSFRPGENLDESDCAPEEAGGRLLIPTYYEGQAT